MSNRDYVLKILEEVDGDISEAATVIYKGPKQIAFYVITLGLEWMKSKQRRERRRELRTEVKPQFTPGPVTGSYVLTKSAKKRILRHTQELFGDNGWKIGDLNLGEFTKEQLLAQASAERASAKGSIRNAQFYEALAQPLQPGQMAKDYWKSETAHKIKSGIWNQTEDSRPDLV
jgi:hypothetical protein